MPLNFINISNTLTGVTEKLEIPVQSSSQQQLSDSEMKRRTILRVIFILVILGIIAFITYSIKK